MEKHFLEMTFDLLGLNKPVLSIEPETSAGEFETRFKKFKDVTECVRVASYDHVAAIVGRQGNKIKVLRTSTNTYIQSPVRDTEPVFFVTGRKENVEKAKNEILSAAEHFTQIWLSRKGFVPGYLTIEVRVPYVMVGRVVGSKGNTIKRIQEKTSTYITTPSRRKEPIFKITGLPKSVEMARRVFEVFINMHSGKNPITGELDAPSGSGTTPMASSTGNCECSAAAPDPEVAIPGPSGTSWPSKTLR